MRLSVEQHTSPPGEADDGLTHVEPFLQIAGEWSKFLRLSSEEELDVLHRHENTGRPLGSEAFTEQLEDQLGRVLQPQKPGPKNSKLAN